MGKRQIQKELPANDFKKQKFIDKQQNISVTKHHTQTSIKSDKGVEAKAIERSVFSEKLINDLQSFQNLYRDFLYIKHSLQGENGQIDIQMKKVEETVSKHIENQAEIIFQKETQSLQNWTNDEIKRMNEEIQNIRNVYEQNRDSLMKSGAFNETQVRLQLAPIQAKVDSIQTNMEKYENLLSKLKTIDEQKNQDIQVEK